MGKHSWYILCMTLAVAGCSSETADETTFEEVDSSEVRYGAPLGAETAGSSGEAGVQALSGDECGSPALLSPRATSIATNIDEADADAGLDDTESAPPSFVPPLTIAALSRSRAEADSASAVESLDGPETESQPETVATIQPQTAEAAPDGEAEQTSLPAPPQDVAAPRIPLVNTPQAAPATATAAEGYELLIPSDGTLTGWDVVDGRIEAWQIAGGVLRCQGAGGGWLQTSAAYSDFVLRGEYRLTAGANTGIAVRFPGEGNPSLSGIEIQLLDETAEKYADVRDVQRTGSLYYLSPAGTPAVPHPLGEWNAIEIVCSGRHIQVRLNGTVVNDVVFDALGASVGSQRLSTRAPMGHIALQSYDAPVEFRGLQLRDLTRETESGLKIVDVIEGSGEAAEPGMNVTVHYIGQFLDGAIFDDSHQRGEPVTVPIDKVILGWREGIRGMQVGGRRRLIVPPQLAYGEAGVGDVIPTNATLVFEVELIAVEAVETEDVEADSAASSAASDHSETNDEPAASGGDATSAVVDVPELPTSEVSSPLTVPPTRPASQQRQMTDPLNDAQLFDADSADAAQPNDDATTSQATEPARLPTLNPPASGTSPASGIAPASSTQSGTPLPISQGPRF